MKKIVNLTLISILSVGTIFTASANNPEPNAKTEQSVQTLEDRIKLGRQVALSRAKGNCVSCHAMPQEPKAEEAGTIGPVLVAMKTRFKDKAKLRSQIWDAHQNNKNSIMPPFGRNKILTDQEIDYLVDYIHQL